MKKKSPVYWNCLLASFLFLMLFQAFYSSAQTADKPNILFIMLDDLNDWTGFAGGHPQTQTPNLDRLARMGTVFQNAYCAAPLCGPSRTSLLTGKDLNYTKVYTNAANYSMNKTFRNLFSAATNNETVFTLPGYLKDSAGYFTKNFNKIFHGWSYKGYDNDYDSLTPDPCERSKSWSSFFDYSNVDDFKPDPATTFGHYHHGFVNMKFGPLNDVEEAEMNDTKTADSVVSFIADYAENPGDYCDRPFMAAVGLYRPHSPYYAPERYFLDYYERDFNLFPYPVPFNDPPDQWPPNGFMHTGRPDFLGQDYDPLSDIGKALAHGKDTIYTHFRKFAEAQEPLPLMATGLDSAGRIALIEEAERNLAGMAYLAAIRYADYQVGRIIAALESQPGLLENTIIVVLGDHGYSIREHQHYHKSALWETDIRVPLIIVAPGKPALQESFRTVSLLDLFPTLLDLSGTAEPTFPSGSRYLDGHSLVPLLENPTTGFERPVLSSIKLSKNYPAANCFPQYSVRSERWHYIRYQTNGGEDGNCNEAESEFFEELYEIGQHKEIDPHEWNNLADGNEYKFLKKYLQQWLPGGYLYTKKSAKVSIYSFTNNCDYGVGDTLNLFARYTDLNGNSYSTLPLGLDAKWHILPTDTIISGASPSILLDEMAPGLWDDFLTVKLILRDDLDSNYILYDEIKFRLETEITEPDFAVALDDNTVSIPSYTTVPRSTGSWDYGDGFVHQGSRPASHSYGAPGSYLLKREVVLNNTGPNRCVLVDSQLVVVPTTAFDSSECLAPTALAVTNVGSSIAQIDWENVMGADSYLLHSIDPVFTFSSPGITAASAVSEFGLQNLPPNTAISVQVSSVCAGVQSEWSYPVNFLTDPCTPPGQFSFLPLDSTLALLNWVHGVGAIEAQQVGYRESPGGTSHLGNFGPTISSTLLFDLSPGLTYKVGGRNICVQYDGSNENSPYSDFQTFTMPAFKASNLPSASLTEALSQAKMTIYPNPVSGKSQAVNLEVKNATAGSAKLEIFNTAGVSIFRQEIQLAEGTTILKLSPLKLVSGLYLVRLSSEKFLLRSSFSSNG